MPNQRDSAHHKSRAQLLERIDSLTDAVQGLRAEKEHLEAEQTRLQKENRALRRELTESRLLNHLEQSVAEADENSTLQRSAPPLAERLYQALPPSFSFRVYFQVAENEDLDMETARRCLQHFLVEDQLVREGSRLRKEEEPFAGRTRGGNGQSSQLST